VGYGGDNKTRNPHLLVQPMREAHQANIRNRIFPEAKEIVLRGNWEGF
jgi:hypothetical protein